MPTIHPIVDADERFTIDPVTRKIDNISGKTTLIQYDHNSERYGFTIPRYVEGHDMSLSTRVEVHYNNVASSGGGVNHGMYEVEDMQVNPENEEEVIFTWLVSNNATQLVGSLNFVVRFSCFDGDDIVYAWHTGIYNAIVIAPGIYNSDIIVEEYPDVLAQWKIEFSKVYTEIPDGTDVKTITDDGWYRGVGYKLVHSPTDSEFTMLVRVGEDGDNITRIIFPLNTSLWDSGGPVDPSMYVSSYSISRDVATPWSFITDYKLKLSGTTLKLESPSLPMIEFPDSVDLAPICNKSLSLNESTLELQSPDGTVESSVDLSSLGGSSSSGVSTYICDVIPSPYGSTTENPFNGTLNCRYMVIGNLLVLTYTIQNWYASESLLDTIILKFQEDYDTRNAIKNLLGTDNSYVGIQGSLHGSDGNTLTGTYPCEISYFRGGPHYMTIYPSGDSGIPATTMLSGTLIAVAPIAQ